MKTSTKPPKKTSQATKHFVTFVSPGTFFAETTEKPISKWDTALAMKMAHGIKERFGATPYSFFFTTMARTGKDMGRVLYSKQVKRSPNYFLGGKVETLAEVEARNDPKEDILRGNMRCNGYDRIVTNTNSLKACLPLERGDVVLDWTPKKAASTPEKGKAAR